MTPEQQAALEALAGRALSQEEETSIGSMVDAWDTQGVADALSVGRAKVVPRMTSITASGGTLAVDLTYP